ncbi:hypothetical protein C3F00_046485, partial [Pseudomonas sp. MWU13-2860]
QSTLNLQQTRRVELLASFRLSAVIRLVEEKVERQRRDQDKTQRDMPSSDWQRPVQRGGKGGNRKGGDSDAAGDAYRPSSPASTSRAKPGEAISTAKQNQSSAKPGGKSRPGEAVAELKRQESESDGWLDKAIDATEKLKKVSEI